MKELIKKYHKLIIVAVAVSVVALYVLPLDRMVSAQCPASTPAQQRVCDQFQSQIDRIASDPRLTNTALQYSLIQQLIQQRDAAIASLAAAGL